MTVYWSDALRNGVMDAGYEGTIGTTPYVRIYSGTPPADETTALSGNTLLWEKQLASDWASNASAGVKTFTGMPLSAAAAAAGTASFYRIYATNGTTCHEQGTVGTSGTDMIIDNTSIASGQTVNITAWTKTAPH
jgi:hypothetical protein